MRTFLRFVSYLLFAALCVVLLLVMTAHNDAGQLQIAFEDSAFPLRWWALPYFLEFIGALPVLLISVLPWVFPTLLVTFFRDRRHTFLLALLGAVLATAMAYGTIFFLLQFSPQYRANLAAAELGAALLFVFPVIQGVLGFIVALVAGMLLKLSAFSGIGRWVRRFAWYGVVALIVLYAILTVVRYWHPLTVHPPVQADGGVEQCGQFSEFSAQDACYAYLAYANKNEALCELVRPGRRFDDLQEQVRCRMLVSENGR